MNGFDFEIPVITPLFTAGGDSNADLRKEGIRPPSIRGTLRFWFRAMMGGMEVLIGDKDVRSGI